jgi:hypothetical protein
MIYGAGCGNKVVYAPYGVCDDMDLLHNIADTWLTNYQGCDFNCDGIVNFKDYVNFVNLWRKNTSAKPI